MATTSITIGPVTYTSPERDNLKAQKVIEGYLRQYNLWDDSDTNMQRLAKYDRHIHTSHAVAVAKGYYAELRRQEADEAAQAELADLEID